MKNNFRYFNVQHKRRLFLGLLTLVLHLQTNSLLAVEPLNVPYKRINYNIPTEQQRLASPEVFININEFKNYSLIDCYTREEMLCRSNNKCESDNNPKTIIDRMKTLDIRTFSLIPSEQRVISQQIVETPFVFSLRYIPKDYGGLQNGTMNVSGYLKLTQDSNDVLYSDLNKKLILSENFNENSGSTYIMLELTGFCDSQNIERDFCRPFIFGDSEMTLSKVKSLVEPILLNYFLQTDKVESILNMERLKEKLVPSFWDK